MYQVEVLVENSRLDSSFSYLSKEDLAPYVRVKVPFNHRLLVGLVIDCKAEITSTHQLLEVVAVLDEKPVLTVELSELSKWMADYYLCSLMR